jgi:fructosamine-3-kinase
VLPDLRHAIAQALGCEVEQASGLSGGDIGSAFRVELADGTRAFVKTYTTNGHDMVAAEADGLAWLAEADALTIPKVLAVSDGSGPSFLALELLDGGSGRVSDFDDLLGRGLAALHRSGADGFGYARPNFIGSLHQDNDWCDDWVSFYGQRRILPLLQAASERGLIGTPLRDKCEGLVGKLAHLVGPDEPPSRLHGDLWGGNLHVDNQGQPALIDPAVYGGSREMDLAMMSLFGGFSERTFAAYLEAWPLDGAWRERIPLYQLYPLLVHVNLFGSSYTGRVASVVDRYV